MSSRRTMILIGAIAVGVLAAFMIFNYVGGVEDQANEGATDKAAELNRLTPLKSFVAVFVI